MLKSKKFWGILSSFFFLWLALHKVDWKTVPEILARLDLWLIILICISYTFEHLMRAYRWQAILPDRPLHFKPAYFGIVLGYLFNNLLPARAGEFVRAFYLKRCDIAPASEAFGSVVFERFLDGLVIITLIVFSLWYFPSNSLVQKASASAIVFYLLVLIAILLLQFKRQLFEKLTRRLFDLFPEKISSRLHGSRESFINGLGLIARPRLFFKAAWLSAISWAFSILTVYCWMQMFQLNMGFAEATLLICVLSIGSMIPTSPGMIGIYQFCAVLVLNGILGESKEVAGLYGIISHSIGYLYVLVVGFAILAYEGLSLSDLSRGKSAAKTETLTLKS